MENKCLTGYIGTDIILLSQIDDVSLSNLYKINKYCYNLCNKDILWIYKINQRFTFGKIKNNSNFTPRKYYFYLNDLELLITSKIKIMNIILKIYDKKDSINTINEMFSNINDEVIWNYFVVNYYGKDVSELTITSYKEQFIILYRLHFLLRNMYNIDELAIDIGTEYGPDTILTLHKTNNLMMMLPIIISYMNRNIKSKLETIIKCGYFDKINPLLNINRLMKKCEYNDMIYILAYLGTHGYKYSMNNIKYANNKGYHDFVSIMNKYLKK